MPSMGHATALLGTGNQCRMLLDPKIRTGQRTTDNICQKFARGFFFGRRVTDFALRNLMTSLFRKPTTPNQPHVGAWGDHHHYPGHPFMLTSPCCCFLLPLGCLLARRKQYTDLGLLLPNPPRISEGDRSPLTWFVAARRSRPLCFWPASIPTWAGVCNPTL